MRIYNTLEKQFSPSAVALGYFDGIHTGHKKVISETIKCKKMGLTPSVLTFSESPKEVLFGTGGQKIMTLEEKQISLQKMGVENLYIVDFLEICKLTPEEFIETILFDKLYAKMVVCGFNYRFGRGGVGNTADLEKICGQYSITVKVVAPVMYNGSPVSSTRIKRATMQGDSFAARQMLGQ